LALRPQHADVDHAARQRHVLLGDRHLVQFQLDVRIQVAEALDDGGQQPVGRGVDEAHGQAPALAGAGAPRVDRGAFHLLEDEVAALQEQLAGGEQFHPPLRSPQQGRADFPFQLLDLARQRRLRDAQAGRGPPEVELLGHGLEIAEVPEVDHS